MENSKEISSKRFLFPFNFDEIDHRLACGWHADLEGNSLKKKHLHQDKSLNIFVKKIKS